MADANNTRFSVIAEATPGTTPTDGAFQILRTLGSDLASTLQTLESREIRSNRNPPGSKLGTPGSGGRIPFELHFDSTGAFYQLLKSSMQSDAATAAFSVTGASVSGASVVNGTALGTNCEVGDLLRIVDGASGTTQLGFARVTLVNDANNVTIDTASFDSLADVDIYRGIRLKNGTTATFYTMEEANYAPGTSSFNRFETFKEQGIEGFNVNIALGQITTGDFQVIGTGSQGLATSEPHPGTPTYAAAPTTEVHDSLNNVPRVRVAGANYEVQSVQFGWTNSMRPRGVVGQRTATGVSSGTFRGSGTIRAYYDDIAEFNKAIAGTQSGLYVISQDSTGKAYGFSMPAIRYGNPRRVNKTQDEQIIVELPFVLETHATENIGLRVMLWA